MTKEKGRERDTAMTEMRIVISGGSYLVPLFSVGEEI